MELYKRSQGKPWLSELDAAEAAELERMERHELSVEEAVQFRSLAHVALQSEEAAYERATSSARESRPKKRSSWVGWLTGAQEEEERCRAMLDLGPDIQLSDAQRSTLAALISGGPTRRGPRPPRRRRQSTSSTS